MYDALDSLVSTLYKLTPTKTVKTRFNYGDVLLHNFTRNYACAGLRN